MAPDDAKGNHTHDDQGLQIGLQGDSEQGVNDQQRQQGGAQQGAHGFAALFCFAGKAKLTPGCRLRISANSLLMTY